MMSRSNCCWIVMLSICWALPAAHGANSLPLTQEEKTRFDHAQYVETKVTVSDGTPARIDGAIHCYDKHALLGFVGQSVVVFKDARGNVIWKFLTPSIGVNGEYVPGPSDKTKPFSGEVPDVIRDNVRAVEVENYNVDQDTKALAEENVKFIKRLVETIGK